MGSSNTKLHITYSPQMRPVALFPDSPDAASSMDSSEVELHPAPRRDTVARISSRDSSTARMKESSSAAASIRDHQPGALDNKILNVRGPPKYTSVLSSPRDFESRTDDAMEVSSIGTGRMQGNLVALDSVELIRAKSGTMRSSRDDEYFDIDAGEDVTVHLNSYTPKRSTKLQSDDKYSIYSQLGNVATVIPPKRLHNLNSHDQCFYCFEAVRRKCSEFARKREWCSFAIVLSTMAVVMFLVVTIVLRSAKESYTYGDEMASSFVDTMPWSVVNAASSTRGVVAADDVRCSRIGAEILRKGGNAIDAAVAAALCEGVVSPGSSGLGGGCFAVVYNETSRASEFYDAREVAPMASSRDMFVNNSMLARVGGLAIAVPSQLKGLYLAWRGNKPDLFDSEMAVSGSACGDGKSGDETYVKNIKMSGGRLPWRDVVLPAARLAERFEVSSLLHSHFERMLPYVSTPDRVFDGLRAFVLRPDGKIHQVGEFIENKALSKLLSDIADRGPSAMYSREIAEIISQDIKYAGGLIEPDEIMRYTPKVRDPVVTSAFGYTYIGSPSPSSGGYTLGAVMKFLDGVSVSLASLGAAYYHYLAEALKHAFALRMSLGDPCFVDTHDVEEAMLNDSYIDALRDELYTLDSVNHSQSKEFYTSSLYGPMASREANAYEINPADFVLKDLSSYGGKRAVGNQRRLLVKDDAGTSHVSVIDDEGNAISITSTVNIYFGSKVFSETLGIPYNNEMDDFSTPNAVNTYHLAPFNTNYIEPGKRPLSSMSPFILINPKTHKPRLAGGASGGPVIITSTAQVLLNVIARGKSLLQAYVVPRIHSQLYPNTVQYESLSGLNSWDDIDVYNTLDVDASPARDYYYNGYVMRRKMLRGYTQASAGSLEDEVSKLIRAPIVNGGDGGRDPYQTDHSESSRKGGSVLHFASDILHNLALRGHNVEPSGILGVAQFVEYDEDSGIITGVSDARKNSKAWGA